LPGYLKKKGGGGVRALSNYKLNDGPNAPVGIARGIHPGRVVWVHDPGAISYDFTGYWWDDVYNNQTAIDNMVSKSVRWLAGTTSDQAAWNAIFTYFNQKNGNGNNGYQDKEKIAIKVNLNNTTGYDDTNEINASPHIILAVVRQLVTKAGINQSQITVYDSSRFIPDNVYHKCHSEFPDLKLVDSLGTNGRVLVQWKANAIPYSVKSNNAKGIATCAIEANYHINISLLKGHIGNGITLCGKNFYGSTSISNDWRNNAHDYCDPNRDGSPCYNTFTGYLAHKDLGEKTLLFMIDALYAHDVVGGEPHLKWQIPPFNNHWPASILVSQDGVAVDSVGFDFLRSEWPNLVDLSYCDNYLHEAAQAGNPPSGTVYDPEQNGSGALSLGVHEHWNNKYAKKYSRNLGTKNGIELYTGE
jgi:hypothetical protein